MVPTARTTELELARPRAADAPRIAAIHLRAMQANPLLWAQFPSEESQHELEKFLTGYYAAFCCGDGTRYGNVGEQVSALAEDQTLISCCRGSTGFGNANVGTGDQTISLTEDENSESCCGGGAGFKKASNEGGDQTLDLVEERQSSSCCGGSTSLKVESKNNSQKLPLAPSQSTEQEPGCADKENGLLVARDSRTGEVVGFVKWDEPNHNKNEADLESTKEKLESGDIRNIEGCRPEYLEGYAMAAEAVRKRAFGDRECYSECPPSSSGHPHFPD
jgi:Queuine tRNA-ribosyltransferases, contain PUA domain